jgi:hypothetical protein
VKTENLACAVVRWNACVSGSAIIIVTIYKSSANSITNPNPTSSHKRATVYTCALYMFVCERVFVFPRLFCACLCVEPPRRGASFIGAILLTSQDRRRSRP